MSKTTQKQWIAGDFYPDWEKLKAKSIKNLEIQNEDFVVCCEGSEYCGKIFQVEKEDNYPVLLLPHINTHNWWYTKFAKLPTQKSIKRIAQGKEIAKKAVRDKDGRFVSKVQEKKQELEKAIEEHIPQFKKGDKVRVLPFTDEDCYPNSCLSTALKKYIGKEYFVTVRNDFNNDVRIGIGIAQNFFPSKFLELVGEKDSIFKKGDKVRVLPFTDEDCSAGSCLLTEMKQYIGKEYLVIKGNNERNNVRIDMSTRYYYAPSKFLELVEEPTIDKTAPVNTKKNNKPCAVKFNNQEEVKQYLEAVEKYTEWRWRDHNNQSPKPALDIIVAMSFHDLFGCMIYAKWYQDKGYELISFPEALQRLKREYVELKEVITDSSKNHRKFRILKEFPSVKVGEIISSVIVGDNELLKLHNFSIGEIALKDFITQGFIEEIKEENPKKWEPKKGDSYSRITDELTVYTDTVEYSDEETLCKNWKWISMFPTKELAQAKVDLLQHIQKFEKPKKGDNILFMCRGVYSKQLFIDEYDIIEFESGLILPITAAKEDREQRKRLLENYALLRAEWR